MRTRTLILFLVSLVADLVLGAGYFFAHSITRAAVTDAEEHEVEIATAWSAFQRAKEFENGIESAQGEITRLNEYFVTANGVVPLLELIEEVGRERNVKILIGAVSPAPSDFSSLEWLTVEMQFSGKWADVHRTVRALESLPYFGVFERLFLERTQLEDGTAWRTIIVLKVLTEAEVAAAEGAVLP
ncbi:MAG: hypothetical protein Q8R25_01045 [bacterium]|nr:hypothetical protein [bacterium]